MDDARAWPLSSSEAEMMFQVSHAVAADDQTAPLAVRLCRAAAGVVGADGGAITVSTGRLERFTLASTDEVAARVEDLQEVVGEGPSVEAYRTGRPVTFDLSEPDPRWLRLAEAALEITPELALLAYPIHPGPQVLGVTTFYLHQPRPLRWQPPVVQTLVDAVGVALLADSDGWQAALGADGLTRGPWASRAKIHQATGMVVAQLRISTEDSLALLRAHAFAHSKTLLETATAVLDRRLRFTPEGETGPETSPPTGGDRP